MDYIVRLYRYVNILSLDVALGAVVCAEFFADILGVQILPQGYTALGLAVWIIYTTDHLMDARRAGAKAATERHRFHHTHFSPLLVLLLLAVAWELMLVFFLRSPVLQSGVVLALIVGGYTLLNRWLKYTKELTIALLYCGGVLLPSVSLKSNFSVHDAWCIFPFLLIAVTNLVLFSWMDVERDISDRTRSLVTVVGKGNGERIVLVLLFVVFASIAISATWSGLSVPIIYLLMSSVLAIIFIWRSYFSTHDRFRYAGDAIFFLPLLHHFL